MIVYHVCTSKKLKKYQNNNWVINPPVRAWESIQQAERFSISTGRKIILRLKFPENAPKLEGHFNQARVLSEPFKLESF